MAALAREYLAHARRYYVSPDGEQSGEADLNVLRKRVAALLELVA